jgi:hypothetical protein
MVISRIAAVVCLGSVSLMFLGCTGQRQETGYHDFGKVQVQFTAPSGSTVAVGNEVCNLIIQDRYHQVSEYPLDSSKLERTPEETATFNLAPGQYEFKYSGLSGSWSDVTLYGNLEVYSLTCFAPADARALLRKTFIPVALPAPDARINPQDSLYPYQSPAHQLRISQTDIQRLAAGDMVTKVVFIADLKKISQALDKLEVCYVALKGEQQRLRACLNEAKLDWLENPCSDDFIALECKLKKIEQKIDANRAQAARYSAVLRADKVLTRQSMMIMATDEILPPYEDPIVAANEIGDVVLVMRIGGRHLHWGCAPAEATAAALD